MRKLANNVLNHNFNSIFSTTEAPRILKFSHNMYKQFGAQEPENCLGAMYESAARCEKHVFRISQCQKHGKKDNFIILKRDYLSNRAC